MTILLTILHIVVSFLLILVVLAQQGKGQDLASAFGGGGSSTAFGARGTATLLSKVTTAAAIIFMLTSLGLSYFRSAISGDTVVPDAPAPEVQQQEPGTEGGQPGAEGEAQPDAETEPESKGEKTPPKKKQ
jgi:preprotein translocase subunit SecG